MRNFPSYERYALAESVSMGHFATSLKDSQAALDRMEPAIQAAGRKLSAAQDRLDAAERDADRRGLKDLESRLSDVGGELEQLIHVYHQKGGDDPSKDRDSSDSMKEQKGLEDQIERLRKPIQKAQDDIDAAEREYNGLIGKRREVLARMKSTEAAWKSAVTKK